MTKEDIVQKSNDLFRNIYDEQGISNLNEFLNDLILNHSDSIRDNLYEKSVKHVDLISSLSSQLDKEEISNTLFLKHTRDCLNMIHLSLV